MLRPFIFVSFRYFVNNVDKNLDYEKERTSDEATGKNAQS